MKTINKKRFLVCLFLMFVFILPIMYGCSTTEQNSFNNHGISFNYPADMEVVEEDEVIGFSEEVSEVAGSLIIESNENVLKINWMGPFEDADRSLIERVFLSYRAGVEKSADRFFLGDEVPLKKDDHFILGGQFFAATDQALLRVIGAWYCEKSQRLFIVDSGAPGDPPRTIITTDGRSTRVQHDWTDLKKDASYQMIKSVLRSFQCHSKD